MKVREAADRLEVSVSVIYALVAAGKLRCCRVGMGRGVIRISEEQLADYLRAAEPVAKAATVTPPARKIRLRHLKLG